MEWGCMTYTKRQGRKLSRTVFLIPIVFKRPYIACTCYGNIAGNFEAFCRLLLKKAGILAEFKGESQSPKYQRLQSLDAQSVIQIKLYDLHFRQIQSSSLLVEVKWTKANA
ncbi:hypothetical protein CHS0354_032312 [Potamilus streckersoni]|uniref:Uncharacterized protein n=1 Tax=Potamilus streckersoni TaxID=2493646 RepID=A0AAE0RQ33_9BIVA|nr:hypothetical protein CHS0354_032312 [Potamilus streckersoni]